MWIFETKLFSLKIFKKLKDYTIIYKGYEEICENTLAFYFDSKDSGYSFEAGQYAYFSLSDSKFKDEKGNSRPFSFASSPLIKDKIMIAVRNNSSVFIKNLTELPAGAEVFLSKPAGGLAFSGDHSLPAVFISGGTGITPARSIIESSFLSRSSQRIYLFYSNKSESLTAFLGDFRTWSETSDNFSFIPLIEDTTNVKWNSEFGIIDETILKKYLNDLVNYRFYLTGPEKMVASVKNILSENKVLPENIQTENF